MSATWVGSAGGDWKAPAPSGLNVRDLVRNGFSGRGCGFGQISSEVLMKFDFKSLPPGTMFFDWNSVPVTVSPDWRSATAWGPDPEPRNPSDVREKADPVDKAEFERVFKAFAALIADAAKPSE